MTYVGIGAVVVIFIVLLVIGVGVAMYLLGAIGLSKMAAHVSYPNSWMAWVPGANYWLMCTLPTGKTYKPLIFNMEWEDRKKAFWAWLILIGAGSVSGVLACIPVVGWVLGGLGMCAVAFGTACFGYPVMRDLFEVYCDKNKAMIYAIISLAIPVTSPVFLYIVGKDTVQKVQE